MCCRWHNRGMRRLLHQFQGGGRDPPRAIRLWKIHLLLLARQPRQQLRQGGSRRLRPGMCFALLTVSNRALTCVSNVVSTLSKCQVHPCPIQKPKEKHSWRVGRFLFLSHASHALEILPGSILMKGCQLRVGRRRIRLRRRHLLHGLPHAVANVARLLRGAQVRQGYYGRSQRAVQRRQRNCHRNFPLQVSDKKMNKIYSFIISHSIL